MYSEDMDKNMVVTINHPNEFKTGVRILIRKLRSKDQVGARSNGTEEKIITRNVDEFCDAFNDLMTRRTGQERIYSTVDARDMNAGIRIFKQRQLDADYYDEASKHSFYTDIYNRWISSLHAPPAAATSYFMVDVDEDTDEVKIRKEVVDNKLTIVHEYPTKNGKHIILEPFNPNIVSFKVDKNALMLLAYNAYKNK